MYLSIPVGGTAAPFGRSEPALATSQSLATGSCAPAVWNTPRSSRLDRVEDALRAQELLDALDTQNRAVEPSYLLYRDGLSGQSPLAVEWNPREPPARVVLPVNIPPRSCEVYRLAPLHDLRGSSTRNIAVSCVGYADKRNGLAAALGVDSSKAANRSLRWTLPTRGTGWSRRRRLEVCIAFEGLLRSVVVADDVEPEMTVTYDGARVAFVLRPLQLDGTDDKHAWTVDVAVGGSTASQGGRLIQHAPVQVVLLSMLEFRH